ncbi:conserved hypothetical protein [Listeria ivanovii FSL F6-596]|nr:conserved hypothetical protein [Listeria ivanovii FSL F6-596]
MVGSTVELFSIAHTELIWNVAMPKEKISMMLDNHFLEKTIPHTPF